MEMLTLKTLLFIFKEHDIALLIMKLKKNELIT